MMVRKGQRCGNGPAVRSKIVEEPDRFGDSSKRNGLLCVAVTARVSIAAITASGIRRAEISFPSNPKHQWICSARVNDNLIVCSEDSVRGNDRVERLAQTSRRKRHRPLDVLAAEDHKIDIALELQMLKSIVQDMDRRTEMVLGEPAREIAIGTREHGNARELSRKHERLIAGACQIGSNPLRIPDQDDPVVWVGAPVTAAQDGGALTHIEQHARNRRCQRRFASAADRKIADADHRMPEPPAKFGTGRIALAPSSRSRRIQSAQHGAPSREREGTKDKELAVRPPGRAAPCPGNRSAAAAR
jgi:hypothetical protein